MIEELLAEVGNELERATAKHGPIHTLHEAYAIILEEVDEFWDEVKASQRSVLTEAQRKELLQIAAMALRTIIDIPSES